MESELVWLEWNYDLLKTFINGIQPTNEAYEQVMDLYRVNPSYADVARRMEASYSMKKQQYDQSISDIKRRITRETNRLNSLDEEGRRREAQYIQDWNNTVREIEEYIRRNVPQFLTEGQPGRTNSTNGFGSAGGSAAFPPKVNPGYGVSGSFANRTNNSQRSGKSNTAFDSMSRDAPWLAIGLALTFGLGAFLIIAVCYIALSILPLTSMILALEASTKVRQRINQPHEKNFFLYIRCVIPMVLNLIALIVFIPIVKTLNDPAISFLLDGAGYINTAFFLQACFFGAVTFSFVSELQKNKTR